MNIEGLLSFFLFCLSEDKKKSKLVTVEERSTGAVSFVYYKNYFQRYLRINRVARGGRSESEEEEGSANTFHSVGYSWIFAIVVLGVIGSAVRVATDWWIAQPDNGILSFPPFLLSSLFPILFFASHHPR